MNLYELEGNLLHVLELAESADEDDRKLFDDTIDSLKDGIEDKAIGYAKVIKSLQGDSKLLDEKIKHDRERKATIDNNIKRLKMALQNGMEIAGKEKIKAVDMSVWIQNNKPSVVYTNDKAVPGDYFKQEYVLEKSKVEDALKQGKKIPGAELVQSRSIRIK